MKRITFAAALAGLMGLAVRPTHAAAPAQRPNIVFIIADDLGYGDLGCYGSYGAKRIPTPNIDRLASQGLRFTEAHATSATCTPSRYGLITGSYPWRRKGTGILPGNAALIVRPGSATLPAVLKRAGYTTAAIGKWHLGLGGPDGPNWNGEITPNPNSVGFDYSFVIPATVDRVPCVFVRNGRVKDLDPTDPITVNYDHPVGDEPTGKDHPELLKMRPTHRHDQTIINGISRIGYMSGGKAARWVDEDMADTITTEAVSFIERSKDRPFFLYFGTHDPHVPRCPNPRFVGKSGCGARGDAIVELDWTVGQVLSTLDRLNLTKNTLVVMTSDNGPVVDDGYDDGSVQSLNGHTPGGPFRGGKYSIYEAGTHVPFILRWPGRVKPGVSAARFSLIDMEASFASLTGRKLAAGEAPDSRNMLPALLGKSPTGRDELVEHADVLAILRGPYKLIEAGDGPAMNNETHIELGNSPVPQLYDLSADIGERNNLADAQPARVRNLESRLEAIKKPVSR